MWRVILVIAVVCLLCLAVYIGVSIKTAKEKQAIRDKIESLANNEAEITPEEFFELRNKSFGGQGSPKYALYHNFAGVYIIYNKTKNKYYVGQAKKILDRVNNHFTGKGNGDVYADYKYGDQFSIKMISLERSGYETLNELERHCISTYNAAEYGYNKTKGNY